MDICSKVVIIQIWSVPKQNVLLLKSTRPHIDQIKNKSQDLLVNTMLAVAAGGVARNFSGGNTTTEFQHLNIFNAPCF